jgi:hypothetical protein
MTLPSEDSQPDPLPKTLPGGTQFATDVPSARGEVTDTLVLKDGVYRGRARISFSTGARPDNREARVRPELVDWASYRQNV